MMCDCDALHNMRFNSEMRRQEAIEETLRPSYLYRPRIFPDGDQWCALMGENIQEGVAAFGDSPDAAARAFDKAWYESRAALAAQEREGEAMSHE